MAEDYSRELLKRAVAQVCQLLGWHAMHSSPLAVLTHVLEKYLVALATSAHSYAEHDCRTEPTLDDLACAFRDLHVRLPELKAYARAVPPSPLPHPTPVFPLPRAPALNFLKPGSREVVTRPAHVHDHLPPMWPDRERDDDSERDVKPTLLPDADPFKRPGEPAPATMKRKIKQDDECHARELSSVMMTVSGYLSPAREGKLPEARTPITVPDVLPEKSKPLQYNPLAARQPTLLNDRLDKKTKKPKIGNGKIEKSKKKDRPQKVTSVDRPFNPNENRSGKPPTPHVKSKQPSKNHNNELLAYNKQLFVPDTVKTIKQEVVEKPIKVPPAPIEHKPPKAPLPPPHSVEAAKPARPTPIVTSQLKNIPEYPLNVTIKEEKPDTEKLTLQPDRSKLNIFKKISTKIKEEKSYDSFNDKCLNENITIKLEKTSPPCSSPYRADEIFPKHKLASESKPSISSNSAVDLTSKRDSSIVINIDDDVFDVTKQIIKQEPLDDYPKDLSRPKISVTPHSVLAAPIVKEKKERKRKDRKLKTDKIAKEYTKLLKKQMTDKTKSANEIGEISTPTNLPVMYPYFPASPGFIPNLIPNPSFMPGAGLFSNMPNKHPFRGLMPSDTSHMLPNPFSLKEATTNLFLPSAPGFIPQNLNTSLLSMNHGFGQPPRMPQPPNLPPYLRRPSLEVIPIDGDEDNSKIKQKSHFVSPSLVIKEKEKMKNNKLSINNSFISNSVNVSITTTVKQNSPKTNQIIPIPLIKPDVTIKLNTSPPEKLKLVEVPKQIVEVQPFALKEKEKDKSEKKKDKLHKKDKKDKEQKIKKKKDKKEKLKIKFEKKREKMEKQELKEKLKKDKKEKKKEKEKPLTLAEGLVPKLTLKLGPPSPMPPSPDPTKRLNIKPIVKKEEEALSPVHVPQTSDIKMHIEGNQSPELAKISALVTRPPKSKSSSKHNTTVKTESNTETNSANSPPNQPSNVSPVRKTKPTSSSFAKYKRIHFKPIPKRNSSDFEDPIIDLASEDIEMKETTPQQELPNVPLGTPFYTDPQGNKVWICPACGRTDNGTPMIACDGCDCWYHWVCVGIHVEPANSENWYCTSCSAKRTAMASAMARGQTVKKRGRKPKMDKLKENR